MSVGIQKQIKDNSRSVSDYFSDLVKWSEDEGKKEKRREAKSSGIRPDTAKKPDIPPPRGSADIGQDDRSEEAIARDQLPMPQYYHNWDQYDPEQEVEKLELQEESKQRLEKQQRQAEKDQILDEMSWKGDGDRVRTSKARPRVKVNIRARGRRPAPVDLAKPKKEEANNYFSQGRYKEAMVAYTCALDYLEKYEPPTEKSSEATENSGDKATGDSGANESASASADGVGQETEALELKVTLLANRAQALIKIEEWQEAIFDCSEALRFNPQHHKAILRRGFALAKQKRWSAAARDLEQATKNDPQDKKAAAELQMARRNLAEQAKEVRAHAKAIMCDATREPTMPARRLTVKVRRPGCTVDATPDAEGPSSSTSAFQPQPRGARGDALLRKAVEEEIEADKPREEGPSPAPTGPAARKPYVPRSVRIRGQEIKKQQQEAAAASQPSTAAPADVAAAQAMNFYSFEAKWTRSSKKPTERCAMLRNIGAAALPALFRESLDAELVGSIISVLSFELGREADGAVGFASSVMGALSRTNRFEASLEALSAEEKAVCAEVLSTLEGQPTDCAEDPAVLRQAFETAPRLPRLPDEDDEDEEDEDDVPWRPDSAAAGPLPETEGTMSSSPPPDLVVAEVAVAEFSLDGCD